MKLVEVISNLLSKGIDLLSKKSRNAEKSQELDEKKLTTFNKCLINITYIMLLLIVLDVLFPKLNIGDWIYHTFELLLRHMIGGE